jgi:hypothetical protein
MIAPDVIRLLPKKGLGLPRLSRRVIAGSIGLMLSDLENGPTKKDER